MGQDQSHKKRMIGIVAKINTGIDAALFYLMACILTGLVVICFMQVVARYFFGASFVWVEEMSITIILWAVWGTAGLAVKQSVHLRVNILAEKLSLKANLILSLILNGLAVMFLVFVFFSGQIVLDSMVDITFFSLPSIPMSVKYGSVPVGCILLTYYILRSMVNDLMRFMLDRRGG